MKINKDNIKKLKELGYVDSQSGSWYKALQKNEYGFYLVVSPVNCENEFVVNFFHDCLRANEIDGLDEVIDGFDVYNEIKNLIEAVIIIE